MDDAELRALLAVQTRLIAELSERLTPSRSTATVLSLYESYETASKSRKSWPTIMYLLRPSLARFGARQASELRVSDWTEMRAELESRYSPSSLNQILAWLKTLLRWGVDQGILASLPHLCRAKPAKCKVARETATTEEDAAAVLEHVRPVERVMTLCACDALMRRNEIRQLQWSWINRETNEIRLPDWACKGGRGRTVFTTARLLAAIDAIPRDIRSPYVLVSPVTEQPYHPVTFGKWWRELRRKAGLKAVPGEGEVHLHDARAGGATNAAERGLRIEVISEMLGHASLETTIKYIRRRARRRADLAVALEAFERGIERDKKRR